MWLKNAFLLKKKKKKTIKVASASGTPPSNIRFFLWRLEASPSDPRVVTPT